VSTPKATAQRVTKTEQRRALWDRLNQRQRSYLLVIFNADQDAEEYNRGAWAAGGRSLPAEQWRWLEYGITTTRFYGANGHGLLQRRLTAAGLRDAGAGSTMAVLEGHGLIITRRSWTALGSTQMELQITKEGRAVVRAAGAGVAPARRRRPDQLGEGHWSMLVSVFAAACRGETYSGSWSGAWDKLIKLGLVTRDRWYEVALTDAGRDHYELGYQTYIRMYPQVDALQPDGTALWPREVDERLARLRSDYVALKQTWDTVSKEATAELPKRSEVCATNSPEAARAAVLRNDRIDARDRLRQLAATQLPELAELRDRTATRYLSAAISVLTALLVGEDPVQALEVAISEDAAPAVPELKTGVVEVDTSLAAKRAALMGRPVRRRTKVAATTEQPQVSYADTVAHWTKHGYLARLLLRRDDQATA
jgi:hypothetical protein